MRKLFMYNKYRVAELEHRLRIAEAAIKYERHLKSLNAGDTVKYFRFIMELFVIIRKLKGEQQLLACKNQELIDMYNRQYKKGRRK